MGALNKKPSSPVVPKKLPTPLAYSANGNLQLAKGAKQKYFEVLVSSFYGKDDYGTFHNTNMASVKNLTKDLVSANQFDFLANVIVFAASVANIRTFSLVATVLFAQELANQKKQFANMKLLVSKVIRRADSLTELYAYALQIFGKKNNIPLSIKKGVGMAFNNFDEYQFGKYNRKGALTFKDLLRIVHPVPKDAAQSELFAKIMTDTLATPYTWETELSANGQLKGSAKKSDRVIWTELIESRRIGYMALLRNLRNIQDAGIAVGSAPFEALKSQLTDPVAVRRSKQFPFAFVNAFDNTYDISYKNIVRQALNVSADNIPSFGKDVLIVVDHSGSMGGFFAKSPMHTAMMFAAMLSKAYAHTANVKVVVFANSAKTVSLKNEDVLDDANALFNSMGSGGTNFDSAIAEANRVMPNPDVVYVLSDGDVNPVRKQVAGEKLSQTMWKNAFRVCFNFKSTESTPFGVNDGWTYLGGFSDKVFQYLDMNRNALTFVEHFETTFGM